MKEVSKDRIIAIINESIGDGEQILQSLNDNLAALGMDSITFVRIIVELEEAFECEIPDSKLLISEMDTVQKIYGVLQGLYEAQI